MIVGTTLIHDGTGTTPYYTETFPRGGLAAYFTVELTHKSGSPGLTIKVETKNIQDTSWTTAGTFPNQSTTGVGTLDVTGLKEVVRLAFTFASGSTGDFFNVLIAPPAWRPY